MSVSVVAGVDLGGTNTKLGLVTNAGKLIWRGRLTTARYEHPEQFADAVADQLQQAASEHSVELTGIGVGAPNGNFFDGTIAFAPNLRWKGSIPLAALLHQRLNRPVRLTNDAKAAALGEKYFGDARGLNDFMVITLGTGLGSGIVSGGRLVYGHDGFAGELGHITIRYDSNRTCGCGRRGCLETYVSNGGLMKTYYEILQELPADRQKQFAARDASAIHDYASGGFAPARQAFDAMGALLGEGLAVAVHLLGPARIYITGGLSLAAAFFLSAIQKAMEAHLLPVFQGKIPVQLSQLPPQDIAVLGAASLIWFPAD